MTDFYSILDINRKATDEQITKAFRDKAKYYHPDCTKLEDKKKATELFIQVKTAYDTLHSQRSKYDQELERFEELEIIRSKQSHNKDITEIIEEFNAIMEIFIQYYQNTIYQQPKASNHISYNQEYNYENYNFSSYYSNTNNQDWKKSYYRSLGKVAYWKNGSTISVRLMNSSWIATGNSLTHAINNLAKTISQSIGREVYPDIELNNYQEFKKDPFDLYPSFDIIKIVAFIVFVVIVLIILKVHFTSP
jgi:curved DNA-binding protein CbpA